MSDGSAAAVGEEAGDEIVVDDVYLSLSLSFSLSFRSSTLRVVSLELGERLGNNKSESEIARCAGFSRCSGFVFAGERK
jgi:hypothetical protein